MSAEFTQRLLDIACKKREPVSGTFELTSRCNLDCRMCYIHKRANDSAALRMERDTAWWCGMAQTLQEAGTLTLLITGGEPLLRHDFPEIYSACKDAGFLISVNTNATLMNDAQLDLFTERKPMRLNISLYGMSDAAYVKLCGKDHVFSAVRENILKLAERGIPMKLNYTVTKHNIDEAEALNEFAKTVGIPIQTATYTFPAIRACEIGYCQNERVTPEEAAAYQLRADRIQLSPEELRKKQAKARKALENRVVPEGHTRCRAGLSSFWISFDGKMRACSMIDCVQTDLMQMPFAAAWESLKKQAEALWLPHSCRSCGWKAFCESCPATCYAENGNLEMSPEYLCKKTETYLKLLSEAAL